MSIHTLSAPLFKPQETISAIQVKKRLVDQSHHVRENTSRIITLRNGYQADLDEGVEIVSWDEFLKRHPTLSVCVRRETSR
jgi:hypothetical protein